MEKNEMNEEGKYIIQGGTVVNSDKSILADVAIKNGKIFNVGILSPSDYQGYITIDAKGKYVLPGGIDPHVHLALPTPAGNSSDDFVSGSQAALSGGTTSFIDFVTPKRGQSLIEALYKRREKASHSLCDWKLHIGISEWNVRVKEELKKCFREEGIVSCKAYLAYTNTIGISYDELYELMIVVEEEGRILLVHCEDDEIIRNKTRFFLSENNTHAGYHALSRPPESEIKAIKKVIALAEKSGCKTYIVHVSTGEGARLIYEAKNRGSSVYGETCIQYLVLDDSVYDLSLPIEKVLPFVISPPIRSVDNQKELWKYLANGTFDTVATDHCPFNLKGQKDRGLNDFTLIPNGAGGIEYRMKLLYTLGVFTQLLSMEQFVRLTSNSAADLFGWSRIKGKIEKGYDADIIIYNPAYSNNIIKEQQLQNCDSNIYEGSIIKGNIDLVIFS
jgi:dihydropyrimidinase